MPIHFTCPHCSKSTEVSEEYAGQSGPCGQCGQTVTIPLVVAAPVSGAMPRKSNSSLVVILVIVACSIPVLLVCAGILVALLLPAVQAAREAARRAACLNNLKQIGLAMLNYEAANGCFPPAYIADENGKPMHSWRVLILPYMEEKVLYDQYDFDEPWDGPNNRALADMMPGVYRCPSEIAALGSSDTSYVMIVGQGTISDGPTATKGSQIKDGTSNTILAVEASGSGINWMEPRDLTTENLDSVTLDAVTLDSVTLDGSAQGPDSDHAGVVNVLFCDGSVQGIPEGSDPDTIKAMATIDGGEEETALGPYY